MYANNLENMNESDLKWLTQKNRNGTTFTASKRYIKKKMSTNKMKSKQKNKSSIMFALTREYLSALPQFNSNDKKIIYYLECDEYIKKGVNVKPVLVVKLTRKKNRWICIMGFWWWKSRFVRFIFFCIMWFEYLRLMLSDFQFIVVDWTCGKMLPV